MAIGNDIPVGVEAYYRKGETPEKQVIISFLKDSPLIVHGGKATNAQLPAWLERATRDWDIFVPDKAEEYAMELEQKLDKRYGGDYFAVESAKHPGTFRVRSRVTGQVVADITLPDKMIAFREIQGINYATLGYHEAKIKESLADPDQAFRAKKDIDTLQRIRVYKLTKKRRPKRRVRDDGDWEIPSLSSLP